MKLRRWRLRFPATSKAHNVAILLIGLALKRHPRWQEKAAAAAKKPSRNVRASRQLIISLRQKKRATFYGHNLFNQQFFARR